MENLTNTLEFIPIDHLENILSDSTMRDAFFNYEQHRDIFSHSKEEYLCQLEKFALELLQKEYKEDHAHLIRNYIRYFLKNDNLQESLYLNSFFVLFLSGNISQEYLMMPEINQFLHLKEDLTNFYEDFYKDAIKKEFHIDKNNKKGLDNLLLLFHSQDFCIKLFCEGNEEIKNYLINSFPLYFNLSKMSEAQCLNIIPFLSYILRIKDYLYFSQLNKENISYGKNKQIMDEILKNEEYRIMLLNSGYSLDKTIIEKLLTDFNSYHKLNHSFLVTFSIFSQKEMLNQFSHFNHVQIISFLELITPNLIPNIPFQTVNIALIKSIQDEALRKQVLKNILVKKDKDYSIEILYQILCSFEKKSILTFLNDIEVKACLSPYEVAFLLHAVPVFHSLDVSKFVNALYGTFYSSFEELRNAYKADLMSEIKEQRETTYSEMLFLYYKCGFTDIPVDDVMKNLFSDANENKKIDALTMKEMCERYYKKFLIPGEGLYIVPQKYLPNIAAGYYSEKKNIIVIKDAIISNKIINNKSFFEIVAHENTHAYQNLVEPKQVVGDLQTLSHIKDRFLYDKLAVKEGEFSENYCILSNECDANLKSAFQTYKIFSEFNPKYAKSFYSDFKKKCKDLFAKLKQQQRKAVEIDEYMDLDYLFDTMTSQEEREKLIQQSPHLLNEYRSDGSKRSIIELLDRERNLKNYLEGWDESLNQQHYTQQDYKRAVRICNGLLKKRCHFSVYNHTFIGNVKEKQTDIIEMVSALIYYPEMKEKIIVYLKEWLTNYILYQSIEELGKIDLFTVYTILEQHFQTGLSYNKESVAWDLLEMINIIEKQKEYFIEENKTL